MKTNWRCYEKSLCIWESNEYDYYNNFNWIFGFVHVNTFWIVIHSNHILSQLEIKLTFNYRLCSKLWKKYAPNFHVNDTNNNHVMRFYLCNWYIKKQSIAKQRTTKRIYWFLNQNWLFRTILRQIHVMQNIVNKIPNDYKFKKNHFRFKYRICL